jgi:hypothetical protein
MNLDRLQSNPKRDITNDPSEIVKRPMEEMPPIIENTHEVSSP